MQEGAVMEIVKWFLALLMLMLLIAFTIFAINTSAINNFKQQVNYEIERNGGLTEEALESIGEYSEDYYGGRFKVESENTGKVEFGDVVEYDVKANVEILFLPVPNWEMTFKGAGVSYVR